MIKQTVNPLTMHPSITVYCAVELLEGWKQEIELASDISGDEDYYRIYQEITNSMFKAMWECVFNQTKSYFGPNAYCAIYDEHAIRSPELNPLWNSVKDLLRAFAISMFTDERTWRSWKPFRDEVIVNANSFRCGIELARSGYVPSFDGKVWRLHTYEGVVYTGK